MATLPNAHERTRDQKMRAQQLAIEQQELSQRFGSELGLAVFAYLHPENWPITDDERDLHRQVLSRILATFIGGDETQQAQSIDAVLWLVERTNQRLTKLSNKYASDTAVY